MNISDVVVADRSVVTVQPRETIRDAVDLLEEHGIGAVIVTRDGRTIDGIISERDIVRNLVREQEGTLRLRVEDLMTESVTTCKPTDTIDSAMDIMTAGHFRHLPVVNAAGHLQNVVSLGDLVRARLDELEATNHELRKMVTG